VASTVRTEGQDTAEGTFVALVRKGSRLITVDGVVYRWAVRRKPTYSQGNGWTPLTFAVERADVSGAVLVISLSVAHSRNWLGLPPITVRPGMVASCIRQALAGGWQPMRAGSPFRMTLDASARMDGGDCSQT
jgi:hypothetical protein